MKTASICTIGDEILIGQIVDTNSSMISKELNAIGVEVRRMVSIGDSREEILLELGQCLEKTDIVVVTGGLGPTKDDITKDALRELSGSVGYYESAEQLAIVKRILEARGIPMLDVNRAQALVPEKCVVLPNEKGTAPGMAFDGLGSSEKSILYALPGVPFEATGLLPKVIFDIKKHFELDEISHCTVDTYGIPESVLADKISSWEDALPSNIKLAYLPNPVLGVRLRLSQYGGKADFAPFLNSLQKLLGDSIYGYGETSLQETIGEMLKRRGKTMSAAESCTGGYISHLMTSISGCSDYYWGSVTSYDNSVKIGVLGVSPEIIKLHGAVSEECVRAMAVGVLTHLGTDYSVATSGIAGPGGGTSEKPVGMVWTAAARKNDDGSIDVVAQKFQFGTDRGVNIKRFASSALNLLRGMIR